jgi:hypothetical protein
MSAGLARNWWAVGLRGAAAMLFVIAILCLPSPTIASLMLMFAAYVAADGAFAILAGMRAAPRGERLRLVILEGATNLAAAAAVSPGRRSQSRHHLFDWPALGPSSPERCCSRRRIGSPGRMVAGSWFWRVWRRPAGGPWQRPLTPAILTR